MLLLLSSDTQPRLLFPTMMKSEGMRVVRNCGRMIGEGEGGWRDGKEHYKVRNTRKERNQGGCGKRKKESEKGKESGSQKLVKDKDRTWRDKKQGMVVRRKRSVRKRGGREKEEKSYDSAEIDRSMRPRTALRERSECRSIHLTQRECILK